MGRISQSFARTAAALALGIGEMEFLSDSAPRMQAIVAGVVMMSMLIQGIKL